MSSYSSGVVRLFCIWGLTFQNLVRFLGLFDAHCEEVWTVFVQICHIMGLHSLLLQVTQNVQGLHFCHIWFSSYKTFYLKRFRKCSKSWQIFDSFSTKFNFPFRASLDAHFLFVLASIHLLSLETKKPSKDNFGEKDQKYRDSHS